MTKIEWTETTWNPIVGCSKASPGCANCYAERMAARHANNPQAPAEYAKVITGGRWNGATALVESALEKPLHWKKSRMVFVCSMADLFHESVEDDWLDRVFAVMALTPHITYQVLTKRPERMREYLLAERLDEINGEAARLMDWADMPTRSWPYSNIWLGVTAENQLTFNERWAHLRAAPAAIRFISYEPALGPLDIPREALLSVDDKRYLQNLGYTPVGLDWVICGGESGPGARPMHPDWARDMRDQCKAAGVPFFFKQWGEWAQRHDLQCNVPGIKGRQWVNFDPDTSVCRVGKKAAGRLLDGVEHSEYPEAARG